MKTALLEIREKYRPDRIIIECSGSAFPATLAFQIRELERETENDLKLDAIVTVIDAENFSGYEDTSPTAKMQASYTDIILINKWEHISERALDFVLDHLNTLNDLTPKIRCQGRNGIDPNLIFGVDSKLFVEGEKYLEVDHIQEVETITVYKGTAQPKHHGHDHGHNHHGIHHNGVAQNPSESNGIEARVVGLEEEILQKALHALPKESVWRVKGFVQLEERAHVLNWAFGRYDLTALVDGHRHAGDTVLLTVMGERGEVKRATRKFVAILGAEMM